MARIPLGLSEYVRKVAESPETPLVNRFFEQSQTNTTDQVALLRRPAFSFYKQLGSSPIRGINFQSGSFSNSLFVAEGSNLHRVLVDGTSSTVITGLDTTRNRVTMVTTSSFGSTPEYLFVADGKSLWLYAENGNSNTSGSFSGVPSEGATIRISSVYYIFTSGDVNAGSPDGSSGNPWKIKMPGSDTQAVSALQRTVNSDGVPGTDYSEDLLQPHPEVLVSRVPNAASGFRLMAKAPGVAGNSLTAQIVSGSNVTITNTSFSGGGAVITQKVAIPDDWDVSDVAFIASFVVVVIGGDGHPNGRFYWIQPGATIIEDLDFATCEKSPDPVTSVKVFGDQLCFFGTTTTEIWYPRGDSNAPFRRLQGRLFDRGISIATDVVIQDSLYIVDTHGAVYAIGEEPRRISDPSIEETIRTFLSTSKTITAWSLEIDGHQFYMIGLGTTKTLCFDATTGSWSSWNTYEKKYLRQGYGLNWFDVGNHYFQNDHDNSLVVGDLTSGILWKVAPSKSQDYDGSNYSPIETSVTGGVEISLRDVIPCNAVHLTCSKGKTHTPSPNTVKLSISDDGGKTWVSQGSQTLTSNDYRQELAWRSLGKMKAPGRLFRVEDTGSIARLEGLDLKERGING